eukprot:gene599-591_t
MAPALTLSAASSKAAVLFHLWQSPLEPCPIREMVPMAFDAWSQIGVPNAATNIESGTAVANFSVTRGLQRYLKSEYAAPPDASLCHAPFPSGRATIRR